MAMSAYVENRQPTIKGAQACSPVAVTTACLVPVQQLLFGIAKGESQHLLRASSEQPGNAGKPNLPRLTEQAPKGLDQHSSHCTEL
jgi:hypothetical protein